MAGNGILFSCFTCSAYLGVDGDIAVFGQARVLVESPELLECIQVSILIILQSSLLRQQGKATASLASFAMSCSMHVTARGTCMLHGQQAAKSQGRLSVIPASERMQSLLQLFIFALCPKALQSSRGQESQGLAA